MPIALYITFNAVVGLIAVALMPNRQAEDHMVEYDARPAPEAGSA